MTFVVGDRVHELSTNIAGTSSPFDLDGAESGMQDFVSGVGDGNTTYYVASNGTDWEVGIGTVTSAVPNTLSRDRIIDSSNSGSAVNWSTTDPRDVICTIAGESLAQRSYSKVASFTVTDYVNGALYECSSSSAVVFCTLPAGSIVPVGFELTVMCESDSTYYTLVRPDGFPGGDFIESSVDEAIYIYPGESKTFRMMSAGDDWDVVSESSYPRDALVFGGIRSILRQEYDANNHPYRDSTGINIERSVSDRSSPPDYFTAATTEDSFECWISSTNNISYKNITGSSISYAYSLDNGTVVTGTLAHNGTFSVDISGSSFLHLESFITTSGSEHAVMDFLITSAKVSVLWHKSVYP